MTVDTGSPFLNVPCSTPASRARGCKSDAAYYQLSTSKLLNKTTCDASGLSVGCYNTSSAYQNGVCFWESELTGGNGYNGYSGVFGYDTISLPASSSQISWQGAVACFDSQFFCSETDQACVDQHQTTNTCPPPPPAPGQCPTGNGTEAGFALGPNSVSSQIFSSGILGANNTIMSFCYMPPPINTACLPNLVNAANRSRVISGPRACHHPSRTSLPSTTAPN